MARRKHAIPMQQQRSDAHELLDLGQGVLVLVVIAAFRRGLGQAGLVVQRLFGFFRQGRSRAGGKAEAAKEPQPDLHIRGDKEVRYERVAQAMAAAQRAGVRKIGFVTEPTP